MTYDGLYRQAVIASGGGLSVAFGGAAVFDVVDGYAADDLLVTAALAGGSGLRKAGGGSLSLAAANTVLGRCLSRVARSRGSCTSRWVFTRRIHESA